MMPALIVLLKIKNFNRLTYWLALLTAFFGIGASGSRKAVILGISLLFMVGKHLSVRVSRLKLVFTLGSLFLVLVVYYQVVENAFNTYSNNILAVDRIVQIFSGGEASFSVRERMIQKGFDLWLQSPVTGYGLGEFARISGFHTYSHNNFIELLVSGGVIAFIFYNMFYVLIIYYANKYRPEDIFYSLLIVVTMLVIDTANVSYFSRSNMIFIVYIIFHFSRKTDDKAANQPLLLSRNQPI
jgi:O-antigen ligase